MRELTVLRQDPRPSTSLNLHPHFAKHKRPGVGQLVENLGERLPRAVPGPGLQPQEHRPSRRARRLEPRGHLAGMERVHPRVALGSREQDGGIGHAVAHGKFERMFYLRVFRVFGRWHGGVLYGVWERWPATMASDCLAHPIAEDYAWFVTCCCPLLNIRSTDAPLPTRRSRCAAGNRAFCADISGVRGMAERSAGHYGDSRTGRAVE